MPTTARILLVDDERDYQSIIADHLQARGHIVQTASSAREALALADREVFDLALIDIKMPGMDGVELLRILKESDPGLEAVMLTGHATVETAVQAMKHGAADYLRKPAPLTELDATVQRTLALRSIRKETFQLRERLRFCEKFPEILGQSKAIRNVLTQIEQVAKTDSTVLIQGETGTGKELVARAIHRRSLRKPKPFVVLNCAAFNENLLESDLFGHEKGAFTSASLARRGLLEVADQGTLFVDEVTEMATSSQARFLRILEQGDFRRLGGNKDIKVDIRVVSATNRDLENEVRGKRFREDLFFRLNVFPIHLPPLRRRKEDIPLLVGHFISNSPMMSARTAEITAGALDYLMTYDWPGNIRELANVVEKALITCRDGKIHSGDLLLQAKRTAEPSAKTDRIQTLAALEQGYIKRTLTHFKGNKRQTARALGISLRNLYRKLEALEETGRDRDSARP